MRSLITEFSKMPGIGPKSAQRLAFFILTKPAEDAKRLSESILKLKESVKFCEVCNNLSDRELCEVCSNPRRDKGIICVVEKPSDVISIEKMGDFHGLYHVLLGTLSPLDGVGPKDLKIEELIRRIKKEGIKELVIATNSNTEGDTTALYLIKVLKPLGVKLYRIAYGMPVGANLEYADQATLYKAFEGKKEV
ncbi:recombination mediator RecR [Candidatus Omnitrophota bacterium]